MSASFRGTSGEPPAGCLSVVMPCYNESATITEVIRRVLASPYVGELVVVDDGSRDDSPELVRKIGDPRVRLLVQPRNMGKGAALRRGLVEARLPYVIVQDADLEYSPEDYAVLLPPVVDGRADVVYGSRFHTSRAHRVLYYWHSVGNRVLTLASNMATNLNLTDMETCYKLFRREVLEELVVEEDRFGFEPEVTAKIAGGKWRIFEVGISYAGRTYAEGKKIGWRDGVRAFYCIGRYGLGRKLDEAREARGEEAAKFDHADRELQATLDSLDGAENYADWIVDLMAPYLGRDILEVGAGHGTMSEKLSRHGHVVASELSESCLEKLRERFTGSADVEVVSGDLARSVGERKFSSVVMVNVLEHIEDDVGALKELEARLVPGGHMLVYVPAMPQLMSDFDRAIGHHRRYRRGALITAAYRAGLEVLEARYVNSVGAAAWWTVAKQLGRAPTQGLAVQLYDKAVVPWLRKVEEKNAPPVGQSLLLVARKPLEEATGTEPKKKPRAKHA